jgi:hypothetical protein
MGTRSLTVMKDDESREIAVMYRQFDGYPDGHGQELVDFLNKAQHNGMDCLAAQIVAHFKTEHGCGGIYLHPAGTRDCGEEWIYTVYRDEEPNGGIRLKVQGGCVTFFGLPGTKQDNMPVLFDGDLKEFNAEAIEGRYNEKMNNKEIPNDYLNQTQAEDLASKLADVEDLMPQ